MSARPRQRHFSMIRDFHIADLFTLANGASGTAAILLAMEHVREARASRVYGVALLVLTALVFDVMDGRIARRRHSASPLGRELDSLADVISFGVAPAVLGFTLGMRGVWDGACLTYFVVCGVSRLARFNATAASLTDSSTGKVKYFEGTPITVSVLIVLLLAVAFKLDRVEDALWFGAYRIGPALLHPLALVYVAIGSAMISATLRIPKP
jgi:CDP-diacylglycerol--serine O-phosphatidyltransferase